MDIDDAHPLPTRRSNGLAMVVIRFKNRWLKRMILDNYEGKRLRKPEISVTQHLTDYTRNLKESAIQVVGSKNVSVEDTVIHAQCIGRSFTIKYPRDIDALRAAAQRGTNQNRPNASRNVALANLSTPLSHANLVPLGPRRPPTSNQNVSTNPQTSTPPDSSSSSSQLGSSNLQTSPPQGGNGDSI